MLVPIRQKMNLPLWAFTHFLYVSIAIIFLVQKGLHAEEAKETPSRPSLSYTDTWLGNTYSQGDGRWIQNNILGLYVTDPGVIYTNSWWDEGRRESGIYSGKDGEPVGMLESLHDSFGGGFAITGDGQYIYSSNWDAVRRSTPDGKPAPFPGGQGPRGDSVSVSTKKLGPNKAIGVQGLAVNKANHLLFVSENNDNEVEVWDTKSMKPVRKWAVERPGQLTVALDGSVWVVSKKDKDQTAKIFHFNSLGTKLPQVIEGGPGFDPTGIWFDVQRNRLLVADNGPDQNIKIYTNLLESRTSPDATFGQSVYSGTAGEITNSKFGSSGLTGVATDAAGNFYISMNGVGPQSFWHGGGTVLESWTLDGNLRWRKLGLTFVDTADADGQSENDNGIDVYDKYSRYHLDLSKTTAGTEWTYTGRTLDQFKYPEDPRFVRSADGWDYTGGVLVRNVQGHKLLYVLSMQARRLLIFRFDPETAGATAIPSGIWESQGGYSAGYPGSPASGDFIWRDKNGNGKFDTDEFAAGPGMPNLGFGIWVDSNGDLWSCNHWAKSGVGIRKWKMQGFDEKGNPIYDYSEGNYTEFQRPEGSHGELRRLEYYPETDTMYVSSTNLSDGDRDAGNRIVKYNKWSTEQRSTAWTLDPPMDKTKISAISVAGDYLFLGYSFFGTNSREGTIRVFKISDASYVGEMTPTPIVGSLSGTFDIPYAIRAYKAADGEYLVFAEDDHYAKVIIHRWNPSGKTIVDTLEDLKKIDSGLSSPDWSIDGSNANQFSRDSFRATRKTDTEQFLVWKQDDLTNFAASIYFDSKLNIDPLVSFASSPDASMWTPIGIARTPSIPSGGGWNVSVFRPGEGALPAGARFLKMQLLPSGVAWNIQLGRMELFGTPAPPRAD